MPADFRDLAFLKSEYFKDFGWFFAKVSLHSAHADILKLEQSPALTSLTRLASVSPTSKQICMLPGTSRNCRWENHQWMVSREESEVMLIELVASGRWWQFRWPVGFSRIKHSHHKTSQESTGVLTWRIRLLSCCIDSARFTWIGSWITQPFTGLFGTKLLSCRSPLAPQRLEMHPQWKRLTLGRAADQYNNQQRKQPLMKMIYRTQLFIPPRLHVIFPPLENSTFTKNFSFPYQFIWMQPSTFSLAFFFRWYPKFTESASDNAF